MADGLVHTVYKNDGWRNATKEEAATARARAQLDRTEHVIHDEDGTIGGRNSYGDDPESRPG